MASDVRTPHDEMPEHLRSPYEAVVASHSSTRGVIWELEDGRFLDPSHVLMFAREHGRTPRQEEFRELVEEHAGGTKDDARYAAIRRARGDGEVGDGGS